MKILYLILFLLCLTSAKAQEIVYNSDGSVNLKFNSVLEWETYKKKAIFMSYDRQECDSLIRVVYRPAIIKQYEQILLKDSVIKIQKEHINKDKEQIESLLGELIDLQTERKSSLSFEGFYAGVNTGYIFSDIAFKNTFLNNLINNISITGRTIVKAGSFMIMPELIIPLNKDYKVKLNLDLSYRLF